MHEELKEQIRRILNDDWASFQELDRIEIVWDREVDPLYQEIDRLRMANKRLEDRLYNLSWETNPDRMGG